MDQFNPEDHPLVRTLLLIQSTLVYRSAQTKFTTSDDNHVGDDYFLNSGDKIRYFLEEGAVDKDGHLTKEKTKAINKIGHGVLRSLHQRLASTDLN